MGSRGSWGAFPTRAPQINGWPTFCWQLLSLNPAIAYLWSFINQLSTSYYLGGSQGDRLRGATLASHATAAAVCSFFFFWRPRGRSRSRLRGLRLTAGLAGDGSRKGSRLTAGDGSRKRQSEGTRRNPNGQSIVKPMDADVRDRLDHGLELAHEEQGGTTQ